MAGFSFNTNDVPKATVIPRGEYKVVISGAEIKTSQAGHERLNLRYSIVGGPYANRTFFEGFNNNHPNPETRGIALRQLAAIFQAIGLSGNITHESQILNGSGGQVSVPFLAFVDVKDSEDFGMQNVLKKPKKTERTAAIAPTPPQASETPAPDVANDAAAWGGAVPAYAQ